VYYILLLPPDHVGLYQRENDLPSLVNISERLGAREHNLARKEHERYDLEVRIPKNEPGKNVRLVRRVDVVPLVQRLDVQNLSVAHVELAVAHDVLDVEPRHGEPLPRARLAQQLAHAVRGEHGFGRGFRPRDDELAGREEQDRAVRPHQAQRHSGELAAIEGRESEDLLQAVQVQGGGGLDLRSGHDVVDEGQGLRGRVHTGALDLEQGVSTVCALFVSCYSGIVLPNQYLSKGWCRAQNA